MAGAQNNTGVFTVTGGESGTDYTYTAPSEYDPNSSYVLTIKSDTPLTISTNNESEEGSGCRIVIENGVTANITLAGVNISPANAGTNDGYSGIDLASGATLNITLQSGSSNVINGGTSQSGSPGPGIHVPAGSTLTIGGEGSLQVQGASRGGLAAVGIGGKVSASDAGGACGNVIILGGTITVQGGTPTSGGENAAVDIGGGAAGNGNGGNCNTVIILTSVNSNGSLEIGGGAGAGVGGSKGSDGQGIRPSGDNTYTVWGNLTLPCDLTIPEGATVTIPEGASLTVPKDVTLTNNGTIQKDGGSFINDGTVTGQQPADSRYTIDYAEETITIGEGYEVYTAETSGDKIENNSSITAYIGQSLYIQKTGSETTGRTAISIPARPEAPTFTATIDYSGEKLNFPSGTNTSNLEYSTDNTSWNDIPSGAALSEMGWDGNAEKIYYFRTGATDASFASSATTTPITAPARPAKPADPTTVEVTSNSITISRLCPVRNIDWDQAETGRRLQVRPDLTDKPCILMIT